MVGPQRCGRRAGRLQLAVGPGCAGRARTPGPGHGGAPRLRGRPERRPRPQGDDRLRHRAARVRGRGLPRARDQFRAHCRSCLRRGADDGARRRRHRQLHRSRDHHHRHPVRAPPVRPRGRHRAEPRVRAAGAAPAWRRERAGWRRRAREHALARHRHATRDARMGPLGPGRARPPRGRFRHPRRRHARVGVPALRVRRARSVRADVGAAGPGVDRARARTAVDGASADGGVLPHGAQPQRGRDPRRQAVRQPFPAGACRLCHHHGQPAGRHRRARQRHRPRRRRAGHRRRDGACARQRDDPGCGGRIRPGGRLHRDRPVRLHGIRRTRRQRGRHGHRGRGRRRHQRAGCAGRCRHDTGRPGRHDRRAGQRHRCRWRRAAGPGRHAARPWQCAHRGQPRRLYASAWFLRQRRLHLHRRRRPRRQRERGRAGPGAVAAERLADRARRCHHHDGRRGVQPRRARQRQ